MNEPTPDRVSFWERPELVERFAAREPDLRLLDLLASFPDPAKVRVLDLGCAGGRNTVFLARGGFDVFALDGSAAMVERTRERIAAILGPEEAARRVERGEMEDLARYPDAVFDLVVGLGVYHQARSDDAWDRAIDETVRVLEPGGRLLYASFSPETAPDGASPTPVPGERHTFTGLRAGRAVLLDADTLDLELARRGLRPEVETVTVRVETETGCRVTVNGRYRRG